MHDGKNYSARFSLLCWKKNVFLLKFQRQSIYHIFFFFKLGKRWQCKMSKVVYNDRLGIYGNFYTGTSNALVVLFEIIYMFLLQG